MQLESELNYHYGNKEISEDKYNEMKIKLDMMKHSYVARINLDLMRYNKLIY